jgi:FSR family fosmidomycin resistance protein-like MFS transporter
LAGALSDRLGRRPTLASALLAAPAFLLLLLRVSGWSQLVILCLLGLTANSTMPVFLALVQESFPGHRALANGLYLALTFVIHSVTAVIMGAMGDRLGLRWAFTVSAAIVPLALPLLWLLPKGSKAQPVQA